MSPRAPLAFFSKVAVIVNLGYLVSTLFLFITWMKIPRDIAQFIAVMGLELAPLINLWGFGPKTPDAAVPSDKDIETARTLVGQDRYLTLDATARTLQKHQAQQMKEVLS